MGRQTQDEMLLCSNALFVDLPRGALLPPSPPDEKATASDNNQISIVIENLPVRLFIQATRLDSQPPFVAQTPVVVIALLL